MRRHAWKSPLILLLGLAAPVAAGEPRTGLLQRGREVVQACFHRRCETPCASPCAPCDEDALRIGKLICELEAAGKACDRRRAADRLDDFNWQCHPEVVVALLGAMQSDCDPGVRAKAADSLIDMKACSPDVIGAMRLTSQADCDKWVRLRARWGVKKLEACTPPCLAYVSGYPAGPGEACPAPISGAGARPRPMPRDEKPGSTAARSVRSFFSTAVSRVKSRL